jgi:tripartite-type tricarboxylate transporter receptor subunit TctC
MTETRRSALAALAAAILPAPALAAAAEAIPPDAPARPPGVAWPRRAVRLIVPVAPGGSVDALARLLARPLTDALGQSVVVENHPGAGGNLAFEMVAHAAPDGHTLLVGWDSVAINPALYGRVPYEPLRDFAPVVQTARAAQVLAVRPDLPANGLPEFLALSRRRPLSLGSPGNGSIGHLASELLRSRTGGEWTHVPYRGGGPASADLLAGHLDALFLTLAAVVEHVRAGRMRALAVSTAARAAALPEVPTVAEAIGLADYDLVSWQGLLAPAGTDPAVVTRLNREVNRALSDPALSARMAAQGLEPAGGPPEALAAILRAEVARWPALVCAAGARPD